MYYFTATLGLAGLIYAGLSILAANGRRRQRCGHQDPWFPSAVRAHGNFAEYAPLTLLLIYTTLLTGRFTLLPPVLCVLFLLGRILHAAALLFFEHRPRPTFLPRLLSMICTLTALIGSAVLLLFF